MSEKRTPPVDPRLLRYARSSRWFFAALALIAVGQTAVIIAFAWLLTRAITGAIDRMPQAELLATLALLAGVVLARAALIAVRDAVAARAAARAQLELREALVAAVSTLGPGWLARRSSAQLAIVAGRGLDALEAYFGRYLPQLVQTAIATPVIVAVMWWQDWLSGLTVVITLPLIPVFMILIGLATRAVQDRQWQTLGALASRFADTVRGLSTLRLFGRAHRAADAIDGITDRYRRETMKVLRVSFLSGFALELLASLSVAIVAVEIGFRLLGGQLGLEVGLFVLLLAPEAFLPLRQVGVQFHAAAEGVAATNDVFAVLDEAAAARSGARVSAADAAVAADGISRRAPAPAGQSPLAVDEPAPGVRLEMRGLRVRHGERTLAPVDLDAAPGTVTLIEGPSGAGKSSLFQALRGAADYDGAALVGGIPLAALAPTDWLAWAGQSPGLLAGTVAANIALGDEVDPALVERALELAAARGIDPQLELGVQGAGLSGGQAGRVAVARAIYRVLRGRAGVLALDEPSSALDARTEAQLWAAIREVAGGGTTVLLISHRTSARAIADRTVTLAASAPLDVNAEVPS